MPFFIMSAKLYLQSSLAAGVLQSRVGILVVSTAAIHTSIHANKQFRTNPFDIDAKLDGTIALAMRIESTMNETGQV